MGGVLDMCQTEPSFKLKGATCTVPIASVDSLIPSKLAPALQEHFAKAQSAFLKVDTEGMDELVLRGMHALLEEKRGLYQDGSPRYLVNFFQFEYSPYLMKLAKDREGFQEYDLQTTTKFLESIGFETFLIGPRFLPLSHGSWNDEFKKFTEDARNNDGRIDTYPNFVGVCADWCGKLPGPSVTADIFAIRSSHPKIKEIKVALGACQESKDFDPKDPQYHMTEAADATADSTEAIPAAATPAAATPAAAIPAAATPAAATPAAVTPAAATPAAATPAAATPAAATPAEAIQDAAGSLGVPTAAAAAAAAATPAAATL